MDSSANPTGMSERTFRLVISAVMVALAVVLSLVKLFELPLGGSVTLCSMLPVMLIGYRYGPKWGLLTGFVYAVIQLLLDLGKALGWGLSPTALVVSFIFDYLIAFSVLGLAGLYGKGFRRYILGMVTAVALRFVSHVVAGGTAYASWLPKSWQGHVWLYSFAYNGSFLLPDFAICLVAAVVIYKPLKRYLEA